MNNIGWIRLVIGGLLGGAGLVMAATVTNVNGLGFGSVVPGQADGTVTVSPDGSRTCGGAVTCIPQDVSMAARFDVSGDSLSSYNITLPASASITDSSGHSMTIDSFADSENGSGTLDVNGNGSFQVGATLHISPSQSADSYSGAFEVLVEYQ